MKSPVQCILWKQPALADGALKGRFELLETFVHESHFWRYLLRCRECGQRYFFEFYEEIDWDNGDDAQYSTFIPIENEEEIEILNHASTMELLEFTPRLVESHPTGSARASIGWIVDER
jgi:hypothetical protein